MDVLTDVRAALAGVPAAREMLEALVAFSPTACLIYDAAGRCVLANAAVATLFGAPPPPGYNVFEDEALEARGVVDALRRALAGETVSVAPMWYEPADGRPAIKRAGCAVTAFPLRDGDGTVQHIAVMIADATAELKAREELDKFERFRSSGILGVLEFCGETRTVVEANDVFLTMLGYSRDDLLAGRITTLHLTPPGYEEDDAKALDTLRSTGKVTPREKEYLRKDGSRLPVIVAAAILEEKPFRGIAFVLDITDRKRLEVERARRDERFRALVANSDDGICLLDAAGAVTYVSESLQRILGYDAAELLGEPGLKPLLHPDDRAIVADGTARSMAKPGTPIRGEARLRHKDGTYRVLEVVRNDLLHVPAVDAVVVNLRDVTESRMLQAQLQQSQKMEAIGQLAGGVAHDFNNMLCAILGFAGLIASELPTNDPLEGDIKEVIGAAERASMLTRQLLAFSRKQILEPKVVDIGALLRDLDRMIRRLIGEDVELVMSFAPSLGLIKVDPTQLEQVVLNLAINARDAIASSSTTGRIGIETANVVLDAEFARSHIDVSAGPYVMLCVTDNGAGMEGHVRERIFEPFFTTKGVGQGTGLGLATVFGIVKQSGGHIWLSSEPGQGTTFKLYFPRTSAPATTMERGPQALLVAGAETLLLVEDEPAVRAFAKRALERVGYTVLEAANGGEALLIAEQHPSPIDLLLTDVVMPRMSGRVLAQRLLVMKPRLRVIYMSGYTEDTIAHQGVLDDGVDFLAKPVSLDRLLEKVRSVLDRAPASVDEKGG